MPGTSSRVRKLQLTDFSRQCLELWIQRHGRRFRCYIKRAVTGVTRGSSNLGTFEAVKKRQGEATASLLQKEKPGSSVDFAGHKLQVYAQASSSSKDLLRKFGDLTQQREPSKSSWDSSIPSPPLRRSIVFATQCTMVSAGRLRHTQHDWSFFAAISSRREGHEPQMRGQEGAE